MKPITPGNDWTAKKKIRQDSATTDVEEPATGLGSLTALLSATDGGAAIDASLSKTPTEKGTLGIYFATFEGADLTTHLDNATYLGKVVWLVFSSGSDILTSDPVPVRDVRRSD